MLDLVLTDMEGMVGNVKLKAAVTMKWWSSRSLRQQGEHTAGSLPWTSGEQALASSGNCLVEYHGIESWKEEGPRKAV